jgi:hypothetical protein
VNNVADLGHANAVAGEDMTQVDLLALEADPAAPRHHDRVIVKGIGELRKAAIDAR